MRRSVVIGELWRPEVARIEKFSRKFCFLEKRPLIKKFSKFCSESLHRDIDRRCCVQNSWNLYDGKSVKACVIYLTKNIFSVPSQTVTTARIAPKVCHGQPQHLSDNVPNFTQIGSLSVELWPAAWRPSKRALKWIQVLGEAIASRRVNYTQQMLIIKKLTHTRSKIKHQSPDNAYNSKLTWTISTAAVLNIITNFNITSQSFVRNDIKILRKMLFFDKQSMPIEVNLPEDNEVCNVQTSCYDTSITRLGCRRQISGIFTPS